MMAIAFARIGAPLQIWPPSTPCTSVKVRGAATSFIHLPLFSPLAGGRRRINALLCPAPICKEGRQQQGLERGDKRKDADRQGLDIFVATGMRACLLMCGCVCCCYACVWYAPAVVRGVLLNMCVVCLLPRCLMD